MSGLPSPFTSATPIVNGLPETAKPVAASNVPSPFPSRTDTVLESGSASARSMCLSPLKSAASIQLKLLPCA